MFLSWDPWQAFDGDQATATSAWASASASFNDDGTYAGSFVTDGADGVSYPGEYLDLQLPCSVNLTAYTFCNTDISLSQSPSSWVIVGSNTGGTSWTTLDVRTQTWTATGLCYTYAVTGVPQTFTRFRLVVSTVGAYSLLNLAVIAEWSLYGSTAPAPPSPSPPPPPCAPASSRLLASRPLAQLHPRGSMPIVCSPTRRILLQKVFVDLPIPFVGRRASLPDWGLVRPRGPPGRPVCCHS